MGLWRLYKNAARVPGAAPDPGAVPVELAVLEAKTAAAALDEFAASAGLSGTMIGGRRLGVTGYGLICADPVRTPTPTGKLPPVARMRAVLLERGNGDAPSLPVDSVEARYRVNVLGEFVPHTKDWRRLLDVEESPERGVAQTPVSAESKGYDRGTDDPARR